MKRTKRITRGIGKVVLALLGAVLMPILIWVALAAAMRQGTRRKATCITHRILATG